MDGPPGYGGAYDVPKGEVPYGWQREKSLGYFRDMPGSPAAVYVHNTLVNHGTSDFMPKLVAWCEPHYYIRYLKSDDMDRVEHPGGIQEIVGILNDTERSLMVMPIRRGKEENADGLLSEPVPIEKAPATRFEPKILTELSDTPSMLLRMDSSFLTQVLTPRNH